MLAPQPPISDRHALVASLRRQVEQIEKPRRASGSDLFPTGCDALDRLLPEGGWTRGTLVEWFVPREGAGAFTLALLSARSLAASGGLLVISDPAGEFYPPAAEALGIDLRQVVMVRPPTPADELWSIDQSLRCEGVALVWASLKQLGDHDFRRLQLAAEEGGTLGFLARPVHARGQPAWSDVQLLVEPQTAVRNRRVRVEVVRIRGGVAGASVWLEIDDITGDMREVGEHHETHSMPQISALATAAARHRQA
jgi:protein ImuA